MIITILISVIFFFISFFLGFLVCKVTTSQYIRESKWLTKNREGQKIKLLWECGNFGHDFESESNYPVMHFKCKNCGLKYNEVMG